MRITAVTREADGLRVTGIDADNTPMQLDGIDQIICATGQRPALGMTSELRLALDSALESTAALGELIDPNLHSCGSVRPHGHRELGHPERNFYTVGVKSYGRAPTFLMMTGYEQVRSVVAALAGDLAAADRVELDLPETGVCSVAVTETVDVASSCCAPKAVPAPAPSGCCAPAAPRVEVVASSATARCCG